MTYRVSKKRMETLVNLLDKAKDTTPEEDQLILEIKGLLMSMEGSNQKFLYIYGRDAY